ncbi:MAG: hypothetical protein HZC40_03045, partial [Chloroflexi bacterium]|nr:hypothetical protein [Chloroflexota bacterium]
MIGSTERAHTRDTTARDQTNALRAVFLEHYARIYAIIFRLVGNRADAEDIALETFIKLWQTPPARADNLGGWLYRVAT